MNAYEQFFLDIKFPWRVCLPVCRGNSFSLTNFKIKQYMYQLFPSCEPQSIYGLFGKTTQSSMQETWKAKITARKYKGCLIISLRKSLKVVCTIRFMSLDLCSLLHCPSKQSMHALRFQLRNSIINHCAINWQGEIDSVHTHSFLVEKFIKKKLTNFAVHTGNWSRKHCSLV